MSKPKTPILVELQGFDPEIDRLLYVGRMIGGLVNRAHTLLEPHEFPQSLTVIAALIDTFNREMETSLLKAYDRAAVRQTLS